jgi:tRNA 2-thiocytidine biosynthesis protein TtcA
MLNAWETKASGRKGKIFSARMTTRPSHFLDPELVDLAGLMRAVDRSDGA